MNPHDHEGKPGRVYDPQSDFWTEEAPAPSSVGACLACVDDGRLVIFQETGSVVARANDGSWLPYAHVEPQRRWGYKSVSGSVLLG